MSKKNGLELLQQEVEIPAVVQRRAQDAFDQIHREAKLADQGIVTMDCEAGRKEQTMKKRGRRTKRALVVAIATAVMVLGTMTVAVASYRSNLVDGIRKMFHLSQNQEEDLLNREDGLLQIIETSEAIETTTSLLQEEIETTEPVQESTEKEEGLFNQEGDVTSVTCNGVTVTLVQAMVDRYYVNIFLRIEGLGEANDWGMGFGKNSLRIGEKRAGSYGGGITAVGEDYIEYSFIIRPTDRNNEGPGWFFGKQLELSFTNIRMYVGKEEGTKVVLEGEWKLKWTMQGTEENKIFALDHELEPEIIVRKIELTPISAVVHYDFPKQVVQEQTANGGVANLVKDPPYIQSVILKDGTTCLVSGSLASSGYVQGSTTEFISVSRLGELLDLEDVESFVFLDWNTQKEYVVPLRK